MVLLCRYRMINETSPHYATKSEKRTSLSNLKTLGCPRTSSIDNKLAVPANNDGSFLMRCLDPFYSFEIHIHIASSERAGHRILEFYPVEIADSF